MTNNTFTGYEELSLSPVNGWRVVYLDDSTESGIWIDPMIGWLTQAMTIFSSTTYKPIDDQPTLTERSRVIVPATVSDDLGFAEDATRVDTFWKVLAPGAPEPTADEIAAEAKAFAERKKLSDELAAR
ncbi:hypothetical protein ACTXPA_06035 [Glutamicibacter arilaitensis]|uniref:hypothetical protein n=1 Tax=Glutamicibacter arilaitensis TaxID=256701 RepID=UPI003FD52D4A